MSKLAVEGFVAERTSLIGVLRALTEDEWAAASGCEGWSVKDVVCHMGSSLQLIADAENAIFPEPGMEPEAGMDVAVEARRSMTPAEVLALYEDIATKAQAAFEGLQAEPIASNEIDMGGLGTHPMHMLANAYAFDIYTHLRMDLAAPRGPLVLDLPDASEAVLSATTEWLLAGLGQMCTPALKPVLTRPFVLELTGVGGGVWSVLPSEGSRACEVESGASGAGNESAGRVTSTVADFVGWSTKRADWRDSAQIDGDEKYLASVLDAVNLI